MSARWPELYSETISKGDEVERRQVREVPIILTVLVTFKTRVQLGMVVTSLVPSLRRQRQEDLSRPDWSTE